MSNKPNSKECLLKLKEVPFFKVHPEYLPFIGENYDQYRIIQVAESHYIPNFTRDTCKNNVFHKANELCVKDFVGWWDGKQNEKLNQLADGWYNTNNIVKWYMEGKRHKGHSVFTNVLKSFLNVVVPSESFQTITVQNSRKYEYFAYMNFWQMPSIYYGESFSKALYTSMKNTYEIKGHELNKQYDDYWYDCFQKSAEVFEKVVEILQPNAVLITSAEISNAYKRYGTRLAANEKGKYKDRNGYNFNPGKLANNENLKIIYLDHPGSVWWNRRRGTESSREKLEHELASIQWDNNQQV